MTRTQKLTAARERAQEIRETASQFTPGPWNYRQDRFWKGQVFHVEKSEGNGVAVYVDGEANARLIAAAPELLAALKDLFEHCAMVHKHWGENSNAKEADAAIKAGLAAIAKAEGR